MLGIALMLFANLIGCAHPSDLHPFRSQKGLLVPIRDPDGLVKNDSALSLYIGDLFNSRMNGGKVLYGHRLEERLRKLEGRQVFEICQDLPCYARAAQQWNMQFILSATVRLSENANRPSGTLTLTRWSVTPLFPDLTVPVSFSLDKGPPSYEKLIQKAIGEIMDQMEARSQQQGVHSQSGEGDDLTKLSPRVGLIKRSGSEKRILTKNPKGLSPKISIQHCTV